MSNSTPSGDSLGLLYSEHHGWLQAWLRRRTGCSEQAADLAQDTFLRVLLKCDLPGIREPRALLTAVARRLLVDQFRRTQLERAYLDALAALPPQVHPSAEDIVLMRETLHELDQLLACLSQRARQAFLLNRAEGLGHAEIAERLGVSVSRVRQYLAQALRQCYLAAYGDEA